MTPYKEYPWGYVGHYSEVNEWFIHHYETNVELGTFLTLLEAEIMLMNVEIDYRTSLHDAVGYARGYHSALRGEKFEPYLVEINESNCTNL